MLLFDFRAIGNRLLTVRKRLGMTQAEVAEAAGLSDRTYADIERGSVNMRIETVLKICQAMCITPDTILTADNPSLAARQEAILHRLEQCTPQEKETAFAILEAYLHAIT